MELQKLFSIGTNEIMIVPSGVKISCKMKTLVNLINENANTNYQMGKIRLQRYCNDVWSYRNYSNVMFGIDLNKKKRESYEGSMDMKDMAVAMAYRAKLDFINPRVVDRMVKGLQPSSDYGKAIWDEILLKMIATFDEKVITNLPSLFCTKKGMLLYTEILKNDYIIELQ